jgi:hypothetical protein
MIFKYFILLIKGNRDKVILGYLPRFDSFEFDSNKQKEAADQANMFLKGYNSWDKDMVYYFRKILEYCTGRNIKVILIRLPVTREFWTEAERLNPSGPYYRKISDIVKLYPVVVYQYDFRKYFFGNPGYFRNPDHMNNKGAPVFSAMLNKEFNDKY